MITEKRNCMYKISDFSHKTGVSVQTLRYYDQIDLFKPSYVDMFSGYRYYENSQMSDLNLIIQLKEIGLSLEDIKLYIDTKDVQIIINKRKELMEKMEMIEKFIDEKQNRSVYSFREYDYRKYVEINGTKSAMCPAALELRDGNARYYVVEKDQEFYEDFLVYLEECWWTLSRNKFYDDEFIDFVLSKLREEYEYLVVFVPKEDERLFSKINEKFNLGDVTIVEQGGFEYYKVKIVL